MYMCIYPLDTALWDAHKYLYILGVCERVYLKEIQKVSVILNVIIRTLRVSRLVLGALVIF